MINIKKYNKLNFSFSLLLSFVIILFYYFFKNNSWYKLDDFSLQLKSITIFCFVIIVIQIIYIFKDKSKNFEKELNYLAFSIWILFSSYNFTFGSDISLVVMILGFIIITLFYGWNYLKNYKIKEVTYFKTCIITLIINAVIITLSLLIQNFDIKRILSYFTIQFCIFSCINLLYFNSLFKTSRNNLDLKTILLTILNLILNILVIVVCYFVYSNSLQANICILILIYGFLKWCLLLIKSKVF